MSVVAILATCRARVIGSHGILALLMLFFFLLKGVSSILVPILLVLLWGVSPFGFNSIPFDSSNSKG